LVDYPGFNLRIAEWGKKNGFKIIYYISPQVWAWKENRVKAIRKYVDQMLVILPFEADFYKEKNYAVQYVGHPLVEVIDAFQSKGNIPVVEKVIAVLPGSRKQEISIKLPIMLEVSKRFPNYQFIVAKAPGIDADFYTDILKPYANVSVVENQTYELLHVASAAMVTSGTATLETALFGVPEVICYKGNALSYQIAKRLIKIKYICLVNLIMDREVVKELIQDDLIPDHLEKELILLLENQAYISRLKADYSALRTLLAKGGHASSNAAQAIFTFLNTK
jgi:lipid-A-disaccharide synthase